MEDVQKLIVSANAAWSPQPGAELEPRLVPTLTGALQQD